MKALREWLALRVAPWLMTEEEAMDLAAEQVDGFVNENWACS